MIKERAVAAHVDDLAVAMDQFKKHTLRGKDHDMSTDDEWKVSCFYCCYFSLRISYVLAFFSRQLTLSC